MTSDLTILLAHFEDATREELAALLTEEGVRVIQARTGPEALERARVERPFLALVSTLLPQVNGFEVCRQLTQGSEEALTVLLTSDTDDPFLRARARHVGARRLLLEPLDQAQVATILETSWTSVDPLQTDGRPDQRSRPRQADFLTDLMAREKRRPAPSTHFSRVSDPLTGLVNDAYLGMRVQEECKRSWRYKQPVSLLVVQIANLEAIAERYGRRAGDEAVLEVAGVFLCESRDVDVAGRADPQSFHLLMPSTPREGARVASRRIQENLKGRCLVWEGEQVPVELLLGVGTLDKDAAHMSDEELLAEAVADLHPVPMCTEPAAERGEAS